MPEGSSSDAPVIKPGPSDLSIPLRPLLWSEVESLISQASAGFLVAVDIGPLLRELRVVRLELAHAIGNRERTDQQQAGNEAAHVRRVRHAASCRCIRTEATEPV